MGSTTTTKIALIVSRTLHVRIKLYLGIFKNLHQKKLMPYSNSQWASHQIQLTSETSAHMYNNVHILNAVEHSEKGEPCYV